MYPNIVRSTAASFLSTVRRNISTIQSTTTNFVLGFEGVGGRYRFKGWLLFFIIFNLVHFSSITTLIDVHVGGVIMHDLCARNAISSFEYDGFLHY